MSVVDTSMEDLPVQVMVNILARLPVKKIIHCKCVCKKWLNIILDSYFADLQLSRSPKGFIIYRNSEDEMTSGYETGLLKWVEVEDEVDHHNLHHDPVMSIDLNLAPIFQGAQILPVGSVDGLACLWQYRNKKDNTYICNPITREYMILPRQRHYLKQNAFSCVYGFGVGSVSHEYKVIRIFQKLILPNFISTFEARHLQSEAEVYTLGTGQWRSIGHVPYNLIVYCPQRKTVVETDVFGGYFNGLAYRPSFRRLRNFENERVHVL